MAKRRYPQAYWFKETAKNRPAAIGSRCPRCNQLIGENDRISVKEVETSWFRGDDEVTYYHHKCPKGGTNG